MRPLVSPNIILAYWYSEFHTCHNNNGECLTCAVHIMDRKSYSRLQNCALYVLYSSSRSIVAAISAIARSKQRATKMFD